MFHQVLAFVFVRRSAIHKFAFHLYFFTVHPGIIRNQRLFKLNADANRDDTLIGSASKYVLNFLFVQTSKSKVESLFTYFNNYSLRLTLIALVSIIGTIVVIIGIAACGIVGINMWNYTFVASGSSLDVLLDVVCISLSLRAHDQYYQRCCRRCDSVYYLYESLVQRFNLYIILSSDFAAFL